MSERITYRIAEKFLASIRELSDKELNMALAEARSMNTTNSWWIAYRLQPVFIEVMENEMKLRDENAKAEASK